VYMYQFTRVPPVVHERKLGAFHSLELFYVFGNYPNMPGIEQVDRELSKSMQAYWVNFAKAGNPNGPGLPNWPAYETATDQYQIIGDQIKVGTGLNKAECDFLHKVLLGRQP